MNRFIYIYRVNNNTFLNKHCSLKPAVHQSFHKKHYIHLIRYNQIILVQCYNAHPVWIPYVAYQGVPSPNSMSNRGLWPEKGCGPLVLLPPELIPCHNQHLNPVILTAQLMDHFLLTNIIQLHTPARTLPHRASQTYFSIQIVSHPKIFPFWPLKCPVAVLLLNRML